MTEQEKSLLLQDLCTRLRYRVKVHCEWYLFQGDRIREDGELVSINIYAKSIHFKRNSGRITEIPFNRIDGKVLPYLRPMSSMTKAERAQLEIAQEIDTRDAAEISISHVLEFFLENHLDHNGLIPRGLALEAPEDMYK